MTSDVKKTTRCNLRWRGKAKSLAGDINVGLQAIAKAYNVTGCRLSVIWCQPVTVSVLGSRGLGLNFLPAKGFKRGPPHCVETTFLIGIVG